MTKINTHVAIDSAHILNCPYDTPCNNLHGHRWEIDIELKGVTNEQTGMLIDFSTIKAYFKRLDHSFIISNFTYRKLIEPIKDSDFIKRLNIFILPGDAEPTAENLARIWANDIIKLKGHDNIKSVEINVAETPNNTAAIKVFKLTQEEQGQKEPEGNVLQ